MWRKHGLLVEAAGTPLATSHAMLPVPLAVGDRIRIFFASCDVEMRGRIFAADIGAAPPYPLLRRDDAPIVDLGAEGTFDCDGINPSCIVSNGSELRLYTIGWHRGPAHEPYTLLAGLATSRDGGCSFTKHDAPILPPAPREHLFRTAPFVWRESGVWHMLYIAGDRFVAEPGGKMLPRYGLRLASSTDGLAWPEQGAELLNPDPAKGEIGFGRPVLRTGEDGRQRLMLSVRTVGGYSQLEADWEAALSGKFAFAPMLTRGPEAWDCEMTCFGTTLRVGDRELLFYNGNGFGRTGIGLAWRSYTPA